MAGAIDRSMVFEVAPYRLSGTVYGTLLNHRTALAALGGQLTLPPYNGAPNAPVLYLKPRNTLAAPGDSVILPPDVTELEIGACLGVVIGRSMSHVPEARALEFVAGYLAVNDVSVPHSSYYRPSIRFKARDGFCPLGRVTARAEIADPDALTIRTFVDGILMQSSSTADLVRPLARLLAEVSDFMTLGSGDVIAVGAAAPAPRVRSGQTAAVEIDGLGTLSNPFARALA
jgi:5-oxopent-3-ene-1,2,5-tricarboxylate decarboxylase/2-hydroxyhepta-2,4-diene-1,7-dioate isomerase